MFVASGQDFPDAVAAGLCPPPQALAPIEMAGQSERRLGNHFFVRLDAMLFQEIVGALNIELHAETGEAVIVEMSHAQHRESRVGQGDSVYVSLRDARIFMEDYAI